MHHSSYYQQPDYGPVSYPVQTNYQQPTAAAIGGYPPTAVATTSVPGYGQHNHPPYYGHNPSAGGAGYPPPPVQDPYQQQTYGATYGTYAQSQPPVPANTGYRQTPYQPPPAAPPPPPQQLQKPAYPPTNPLTMNPAKTGSSAKNPFGQAGPYGSDATNPLADYYRKLYYPYDPITGEYVKDATPPDDSGGGGAGGGPGGDMMGGGGGMMPGGMMGRTGGGGGGGQLGGRYGMDGGMGGGGQMMMGNYYGGQYDNEDSLLLCCDFLIPRPNIKCLLIILFILLVSIILIAVIRFLVGTSPGGHQHDDVVKFLEQICIFLLIGAFLTLLAIIGVYFTSRRTRHQIANMLSCATNPLTVETTLVPSHMDAIYGQQPNGYMYSNPVVTGNRFGGGPSGYGGSGYRQQSYNYV